MLALCTIISFAAYGYDWYGKLHNKDKFIAEHELSFTICRDLGVLMTAIIVFVQCYSVVTIRTIISKQGLSKRVNYKMFFINAGAFAFYELASITWCFY